MTLIPWMCARSITVDGAPPAARNKPYGYTHRDGTNAIVYVSDVGDITELYLASDGWRWGWLGGAKAVGNPTANEIDEKNGKTVIPAV